jgi:phosphate transport system substrate-binding protein
MWKSAYLFTAALVLAAAPVARAQGLKGEIKIDGSSTVYLISEAMASKFKTQHPDVKITVGLSGTGGGFKKFATGETDINDASRAIKPPEVEACKKGGIEYYDFQVAWDGIAVVINPQNDWAKNMTVEQLRKIWHPEMAAKMWSDVDPAWPKEPIKLYGMGEDSGTFDYFTEAINGKEKLIRKDYEATAAPNVTVRGVAGNKYAIGFFGLAYYEANSKSLGLVNIAEKPDGKFITPTTETVLDGTYKPLSRPLFVYVKKDALKRPEVQEFIKFYLRRGDLVSDVGYVDLNRRQRSKVTDKFEEVVKSLK